ALPLGPQLDDGGRGVGLLLIGAPAGALSVSPELQWVADQLGARLAAFAYTQLLKVERRMMRGRALLYRVINAAPDPSLLTDTEGRLILTNTSAERLFSAEEEDSEGRRRAVTLNNMLFSAALSTGVRDGNETPRELPLVDPTEGRDLLFELLSTHIDEPGAE